jgi:hypothetical protein
MAAGILFVNWPAAKAKAQERGMTLSAIDEAFTALRNRRYLPASAFRQGIDTVVPGAEVARRQVIAILVNDPPASDRPMHELARLTGKPVLFIEQFLYLGGFARITVSPTLKRLL